MRGWKSLKLPTSPVPGTLVFQCNICGERGTAKLESLTREARSCLNCKSSPRTRAVIRALSRCLFQKNLILSEFPSRKDLVGLGLTDASHYASRLKQKFDYTNTFFHKEPFLDIASDDIPPERRQAYDFIISSDVFEHVVPPIEAAFMHVFQMLKPGALFLLTVPYGLQPHTIEHFPELYRFTIAECDGARELHNITRSGARQTYRDLVFHDGPGTTLEMRAFACSALLSLLRTTGFENIVVHNTPDFQYGIWWPQSWSFPITARKPVAALS
jgi:SAM-dependent methyltransferase